MTRTEIRYDIERKIAKAQSQRTDRMGYYSEIDRLMFTNELLINEIAKLQYQINGLRGLNLAPGEFRVSLTESNPYQFTSPEDIK